MRRDVVPCALALLAHAGPPALAADPVAARVVASAVVTPAPPAPSERFLSRPVFLSFGALVSFGNADLRTTGGGELTFVRWFSDGLSALGLGGYAQGEYVAGGAARGSVGAQVNVTVFGLEAGYAYQTSLGDRTHVHAVQLTPFFSLGIAYVGARFTLPTGGGAPSTTAVVGVKIPLDVGAKVRGPRGFLPFD